ncbi:transposase [Nocardia sp. NPDC059246]|uniref:transposase n=1 Tax=unclassified Nocardia TaxID=2637762 RepID=UPI00368D6975
MVVGVEDPGHSACQSCPAREQCTRSAAGQRLTLQQRAQHQALQIGRTEQTTEQWQQRYQHRAGVEGTIAQGIRSCGLRRSRYRGLPKTRLQHLLTAAGLNLNRLNTWWETTPFAPTRTSPLAALRPAARRLNRIRQQYPFVSRARTPSR